MKDNLALDLSFYENLIAVFRTNLNLDLSCSWFLSKHSSKIRSRSAIMGTFGQSGCPIALHSNRLSRFVSFIIHDFVIRVLWSEFASLGSVLSEYVARYIYVWHVYGLAQFVNLRLYFLANERRAHATAGVKTLTNERSEIIVWIHDIILVWIAVIYRQRQFQTLLYKPMKKKKITSLYSPFIFVRHVYLWKIFSQKVLGILAFIT